MKKFITIALLVLAATLVFTGCDNVDKGDTKAFDSTKEISVVSREQGSGTRGAFIELLKVEVKDADGTKQDKTTDKAIIQNNTEGIISQVSSNEYAIGYISLGSLNDTVKALSVDGVEATAENIKSGKYKVSRPFIVATKGELKPVSKDFMAFIMSKEGQKVVGKSYITINDNAAEFISDNSEGKIVVGGSSSVSPLMEKLIEAYKKINAKATIELQATDSGTGLKNAGGSYDIGMSSRLLNADEKSKLSETTIALDGIAIIVNKSNPLTDMSSASITKIYKGEATKWDDAK